MSVQIQLRATDADCPASKVPALKSTEHRNAPLYLRPERSPYRTDCIAYYYMWALWRSVNKLAVSQVCTSSRLTVMSFTAHLALVVFTWRLPKLDWKKAQTVNALAENSDNYFCVAAVVVIVDVTSSTATTAAAIHWLRQHVASVGGSRRGRVGVIQKVFAASVIGARPSHVQLQQRPPLSLPTLWMALLMFGTGARRRRTLITSGGESHLVALGGRRRSMR